VSTTHYFATCYTKASVAIVLLVNKEKVAAVKINILMINAVKLLLVLAIELVIL
jgi:hypothetical protein